MKIKGYILAIMSALTYGMIPLFAIPLKQMEFPFDTVLFYRFMFSALIIGGYLLIKRTDFRVNRKEAGALGLLAVMFSLSSHFLFTGYDYMPAGVASTILFLYPVLVAFIMGIGFREKIPWIVWVAIVISFVGIGVLNMGDGQTHIPPIGIFIVFLSALAYAVYMVIVNKSVVKDMDGAKVTFYSTALCSLIFLTKGLAGGTFVPIPSLEVGGILVLFALVTSVISLLTMVYAIKIVGPTTTAILGSMEPVVAVAISVAVFHEPFTKSLIVGILLIIAAVMMTILADYFTGRKATTKDKAA